MICPNCGNNVTGKFCTKCGTKLDGNETSVNVNANPVQFSEAMLPEEYKPVSVWMYVGYMILFSICCVGWIVCIIFAFGGCKSINLRNLARAQLVIMFGGFLLYLIFIVMLGGAATIGSMY